MKPKANTLQTVVWRVFAFGTRISMAAMISMYIRAGKRRIAH